MNHYAKLWDGEKAHENLRQLFINSTLPNLFDNHPPFQIDGNFGSIAAMAEMLVQSDDRRIVLLPALPAVWRNGMANGIKVRGDAKINIKWSNLNLESAQICSGSDCTRRIMYNGKTIELELKKDKPAEIKFD